MKPLTILATMVALAAVLPVGCSQHDAKEQEGTSAHSARVHTLNESNFDAEIQTGVVLVDFWATWCGPCRMQAPIVDQVADQLADKVKVAKLDVDAAPKIAQRFSISAIPSLVIFKNGKLEKQFVGLTKADTLVAAITAATDSK
jgi:thioredoxin 1